MIEEVQDFFGWPTYCGGNAGSNSAYHFACPLCGADVVDMHGATTNRLRHHSWHNEQNRR